MKIRLGIKGKQVLYVTSIVCVFVVVVSLLYLAQLAQVRLTESRARAEMLAQTLFYRAREVVVAGADPYEQLRADSGLRSILASSLAVKNVMFAAIVDTQGGLIAKDPVPQNTTTLPPAEDMDGLLARSPFAQLRTIYQGQGRNLEVRQPLLIGDAEIGSIRIGVSTLLIRGDLDESLSFAAGVAAVTVALAVVVSMLLAQLILRPIHVIRSGLTRLQRGESVKLDIASDDEFGELGTFFNTVSEQLSADRSQMAGQMAHLESAVDHLEDAVAIVSPTGHLIFANPAARTLFPEASEGAQLSGFMPADHPLRQLFEQTLASGQANGPLAANLDGGERLILGHPVNDAHGALVGIMMIVRNLEYLSQVQSTVRYSRKLAALGRLSAGVAHEVKNPLNAMMIHLELLRQQLTARVLGAVRAPAVAAHAGVATAEVPVPRTDALQHIDVIAAEIRRLDEVVQGFLKFARPEDLKLQPLQMTELVHEIVPVLKPEADRSGVTLTVEGANVPDVNGDPAMLKQAFLNLGLNAVQAMPNGGTLTIRCESVRGRRVSVLFTDTGVGISPDNLKRIFDLYFTTKSKGSGIGLSMVFRTVQMHDGEIEVQSTPGVGTVFKVLLPQS